MDIYKKKKVSQSKKKKFAYLSYKILYVYVYKHMSFKISESILDEISPSLHTDQD